LLGAVEHIVIAIAARPRLEVRSIRTCLRLRQRKTTDPFATRKLRQEALPLVIIAEFEDRHAADRAMHTHDGRAWSVTGGDFFECCGIGDDTGVGSAIGFRDQHAEQTEFAHFLQFFTREKRFPVALRRSRRQPFPSEVAG